MGERDVSFPVAWHRRAGFTFRWGRGDPYMTVHRGDHVGSLNMSGLVDRVPVPPSGWTDQEQVRQFAERWLRSRMPA
ncbi:MAG TPA: hypothetical protein VIL00_15945 [Pseudonocardiaceae bacterium]